ncbi:response regulator transcription factor [Permianibacter sp. IMCC34836]|uniref:response regulator n=1 Tax=Permianibacter fluminis TaxID=2738515 RepID=UPI001557C8EE|nr:response regulator transcription factor [Permianibacter fluminis]NQD38856.1 response regulator transcription factor [Permianibacter fluminis]
MISLLLADDHAVMREGLRLLLASQSDFKIISEAGTGTDALNAIIAFKPDIALLDVSMPGISGMDVLRTLMEQKRTTKVVLLSMHDNPQLAAEAMALGASAYVLKGGSASDIVHAIRQAARGQTFVSPSLAEAVQLQLERGIEQSPLALLSSRERQVLQLVVEGKSSSEIGTLLHLSPKTVDTYRSRLMQKLDVGDVPGLVRLAVRLGILS